MRKTLIIGATSAIAQDLAKLFAEAGDAICLVARSDNKLKILADDLQLRGASSVAMQSMDVLEYERHQSVIDSAVEALGGLDLVVIAHGTLPDQAACQDSPDLTKKEFEVNALTTISLLTNLANYFEAQQRGSIVVISSVAGDRGRQSNYVYGAAKGAVTIFLQGLRNRLTKSGVNVLTVKPGFVDTPMTADFPKGALWASSEKVAQDINKAIDAQKSVAYVPWFWRYIMLIIKSIPEMVFKKLSL
ncbi:MAG: SDR family oxidoreductase [Candidatus Thiodiazotropha taylori]|nr:SDR family oxidoreductase [Candidatus Thiodiazotropha taylori]MCG7927607.1 SDR family oxidoreductase [Candidatus Thiodiazotropha taylori]MCG7935506.1 SDR family oxidoreductase [Candidatus Thiodiazotropha taylori]MCG7972568.1 SDR family oxidoreductase [Candidatus Thiodiazotropha taylori]MCG8086151.1 SDR family oxidoreductase [Candidatus Thiodiazotropha taylori]